jgi:hypothetical protein
MVSNFFSSKDLLGAVGTLGTSFSEDNFYSFISYQFVFPTTFISRSLRTYEFW